MPLARSAELFLVSSILPIATANYLLDLASGACVIVDEHSFVGVKHADTRLLFQDCLGVNNSGHS